MKKYRHLLPKQTLHHLRKRRTFVLYSIIGASGALLDFIAFLILYKLGMNPSVASFISVSLGITNNFILNRQFNFKVSDKTAKRFAQFYTIGLSGAVVSAVLILLFSVAGMNPVIAKILTIPFIVVAQYVLNKRITFAQGVNYIKLRSAAVRHIGIIVVCTVFLLCALAFVKTIPFPGSPKAGPDESGHFKYNVEFIIENKRLPVAGKDDLKAYETCRDNDFGKVTCSYSYVAYPGANYVISASSAILFHDIFGLSYHVGARLASVMWGIIFLIFLYLAILRLSKNRTLSWALTAALGLIPQVIFVFSYTNQDAHSLAISAIVAYALVRALQSRTTFDTVLLGVVIGGILPLAKYNYFILFPFIVGLYLFLMYKKYIPLRTIKQLIIAGIASFLIIASFWYIRNFILYHDLLGQSYILQLMSEHWQHGTSQPINMDTLRTFTQLNFFDITFRSFFLSFGYMAYYMDSAVYDIIRAAIAGVIAGYAYIALTNRNVTQKTKLLLTGFGFLLLVLAAVGLSFYNSALYDFQPQGRYIYQILVPFGIALAYAYSIDKRIKYVVLICSTITLLCLTHAVDIFVRVYL